MADKKFTIAPGSKVIIEINRASEVQSPRSKAQTAKGLIQTRRENEYLPRRQKSGDIKIYDLGRIRSESVYATWSNYLYQDFVEQTSGDYAWETDLSALETLWATIETNIFAVPVEDWRSKFFRIAKGNVPFEKSLSVQFERAGELVTETLDVAPEWKEKGLEISSPLKQIFIDEYLFNYNTVNFETDKITTERDPLAEAVAFTPSGVMDIFLFPSLLFNSSEVVFSNGSTFPAADGDDQHLATEYLNKTFQLFPRELFDEYANVAVDEPERGDEIVTLMTQFPFARVTGRERYGYVFGGSSPEYDGEAPGYYLYRNYTTAPSAFPPSYYSYPATPDINKPDTGRPALKAVVLQNGAAYYVWHN